MTLIYYFVGMDYSSNTTTTKKKKENRQNLIFPEKNLTGTWSVTSIHLYQKKKKIPGLCKDHL